MWPGLMVETEQPRGPIGPRGCRFVATEVYSPPTVDSPSRGVPGVEHFIDEAVAIEVDEFGDFDPVHRDDQDAALTSTHPMSA